MLSIQLIGEIDLGKSTFLDAKLDLSWKNSI